MEGREEREEPSAKSELQCLRRKYLTERFHQGIGGQVIRKQPGSTNDNGTNGRIACR